ncbi:MAG: hypothetical protein NTU45_00195, partial [Planctomycetota bacterium]|nr:hypothetical protein [Planctomycetota bacterium]
VFAPWAGVATAYAGGGFVSAAVGVAAEGGVVAGLFSGFTYQVLNYWEGGDFNPVLIWQEAILGGVLAGKFQAVYGVGRAGLGAMMAKRNAQPGGVARPGPGVHYEGEGARLQTTAHGAERIAGLGATRGGVLDEAGIDLVRARGDVLYQADGATVRVLQIESGRFNVVVEGERGIITTFERLSKKSLDRLSSRYGWKCD